MRHLGLFDYVFIAMVIACFFIRAPREYRSKQAKHVESRDQGKEKFNLMLVFTGSVTLPLIYLFSPWLGFADYSMSTLQGYAGCAGAVVGLWLFWKSHADLGRHFSPMLEIKDAHTLVSQGVYKKIRHPMYTAAFLLAFSQALLVANWVAGPAFLLAFLLLYNTRIRSEEKMMLDHFGTQYSEYSARTNRLLPSWRK